jgi:hypothetical protein
MSTEIGALALVVLGVTVLRANGGKIVYRLGAG